LISIESPSYGETSTVSISDPGGINGLISNLPDHFIYPSTPGSEEFLFRIQKDIKSGEESGVSEVTPAFFLNGIIMDHPTNYDIMRREIQGLLQENRMSF